MAQHIVERLFKVGNVDEHVARVDQVEARGAEHGIADIDFDEFGMIWQFTDEARCDIGGNYATLCAYLFGEEAGDRSGTGTDF